ncbi:hypothetical protein OS493_027524 [Desmophyllum pertusum]|uniref:Uncharacterized protein n=1 Tax=Desmophyllum pertusum TaxID=174260 RepID=A0A9W9Y9F2_9CNID|nr:hypothetical protein OS493_027524 [Desmophyllum pertusum]
MSTIDGHRGEFSKSFDCKTVDQSVKYDSFSDGRAASDDERTSNCSLRQKIQLETGRYRRGVYVTDYDSLRLEGLKKKKDIAVEDFLECRNLPRDRLYGVIFQEREPSWLSRIRSAEVFNFKKRLADVLHVKTENVFWIQAQQGIGNLLSVTMSKIYRCREDKESEANEKIARGEIKRTKDEKQKELLEPTTMLYGELAEKNGIVLAEGV